MIATAPLQVAAPSLWQRSATTVMDAAQYALVNTLGLALIAICAGPALAMSNSWARRFEWEQNRFFFLITHYFWEAQDYLELAELPYSASLFPSVYLHVKAVDKKQS